MFTFKDYLLLIEGEEEFDIPDDKGAVVMASGNMNPPTRGHLTLAQYVEQKAKELNAPAYLYITKSNKGKGIFSKDAKDQDLAGKLYRGDKTTKKAVSDARSPLSPEDKMEFVKRLFNEINKLDINVIQSTNPQSGLGDLIKQGYTDITYFAGSEYFDDPKDKAMLDGMENFVYNIVNPGRKKQDPNAPMVNFTAVPIERDPNATSGTASYKGSKARKEIHGHAGGITDEQTARRNYQKTSGWDTTDEERDVSDDMFNRAMRSYRGE